MSTLNTTKLVIAASVAALLTACGGGGGGTTSTPQTGVFSDSLVEGLNYKTETQSGVTDKDGKFKFLPGETITFSIGAINLPSAKASVKVTPLDLVGVTDANDRKVANILVLLQSLDSDGNPSNGITIPTSATSAATTSVNFDQATGAFATNSTLIDFIKNAGGVNKSLFSVDSAVSHFNTSQAGGATGTQIIKLGFAGPLTGAFAALGTEMKNGVLLAIDDMNAAGFVIGGNTLTFSLESEDDQASAANAPTAATNLIAKGVVGVVGHLNSGASFAAAPTYSAANVAEISASSTAAAFTNSSYATSYRVVANDLVVASVLQRYMFEKVVTTPKIGIIHDGLLYGQGIATAFANSATASGATIIGTYQKTSSTTDYTTELNALKNLGANVIFYGGAVTPAGLVLKQMNDVGVDAKFVGGDGICTSQLVTAASPFTIPDDKVYCAEAAAVDPGFSSKVTSFKTRYFQKYGSDVLLYAPFAYDAARIIGQSIVQVGSVDKVKILSMLHNVAFVGITGITDFDANGDIVDGSITIYKFIGATKTPANICKVSASSLVCSQ
jgi:branched-chain amino acid transport system substrate-binding protein